MAHLHFGHALADARIDLPQVLSLLSNPGHDAGRADQRRAEKIAQSLRGPILGNELLDIEIDRRGPDALAILSGRDHSLGKRRLRLAAAMRATVDRGLMFRNHERALGKVEHLALLDPDRRLRFEQRTAMAAGARLVPNHMIGIGDLPQRAALMGCQLFPYRRSIPQPELNKVHYAGRIGVSASVPGTGWLGYARVDYRNGENIEALSVNGGLRYQFA